MILSDNNIGVDKTSLLKLYNDATREKFNFLKIDLATSDENKKFSHNFTEFYNIKND